MRDKRPFDSGVTVGRSSRHERQGQLDIEMESALRPREIQTRIRAGESVDDLARAAGVPVERIELYAGPVLAEREHIAAQAQRGSVRRRGETAGHRVLRTAVAERLATRGVDPETVIWDSLRMEDGRWSVMARYASGESNREATFFFDPKGRFSVAGNDEARWLLGEQSPTHGPQPGRRSPSTGESGADQDLDAEPTLDLNDQLALVRVVQDSVPTDVESGTETTKPNAGVVRLVPPSAPDPAEYLTVQDSAFQADQQGGVTSDDESAARADSEPVTELDERSELDLLFDMLGGEGYSEDSGRVYSGLTDARPDGGWEPAVVVNYPADYPAEATPDPLDHEVERFASDDTSDEERRVVDEPEELELPLEDDTPAPATTELPAASVSRTDDDAARTVEVTQVVTEVEVIEVEVDIEVETDDVPSAPEPPVKKAASKKRKRAEVPSWDEIMFGGPKRP